MRDQHRSELSACAYASDDKINIETVNSAELGRRLSAFSAELWSMSTSCSLWHVRRSAYWLFTLCANGSSCSSTISVKHRNTISVTFNTAYRVVLSSQTTRWPHLFHFHSIYSLPKSCVFVTSAILVRSGSLPTMIDAAASAVCLSPSIMKSVMRLQEEHTGTHAVR
jgi:hypothetical protein